MSFRKVKRSLPRPLRCRLKVSGWHWPGVNSRYKTAETYHAKAVRVQGVISIMPFPSRNRWLALAGGKRQAVCLKISSSRSVDRRLHAASGRQPRFFFHDTSWKVCRANYRDLYASFCDMHCTSRALHWSTSASRLISKETWALRSYVRMHTIIRLIIAGLTLQFRWILAIS